MEDPVVKAAQDAFSLRLVGSSDASDNTKNAQRIAKKWRSAVHGIDPDRYQIEVPIHGELDQKIDVVDSKLMCAYEFKVSGKNAPNEFYKDIVKVILWNRMRSKKLLRLVFITDAKDGKRFLQAPMPREYIQHVAENGIEVTIEYVQKA